jgi:DUF4097 and DUF4098 domain-containing protein YvlB
MCNKNVGFLAISTVLMVIPVIQVFSGELNLVNTQTIDLSGIRSLNIKYSSDDIVFKTNDTNNLILKEYFIRDTPKYYASISKSLENITIRHGKRPIFLGWLFWRKGRIEIYLPKNYKNNIGIALSSGTIHSENDLCDFNDFRINLSSGSLKINKITAKTIDIDISSGNMEFSELSAEDINTHSSSGRTIIDSLNGNSNISSSSGSISIEKFSGSGILHSSSGGINMGIVALNGDLDFRTSSGSVVITIPDEISFTLDAHISSGKVLVKSPENSEIINSNGTVKAVVGINPILNILAQVSSGNFTIQQKN